MGDAPEGSEWIDSVLEYRDLQIKLLTEALSGRLAVGTNLNAEVRELSVLHDTELILKVQKTQGTIVGVLLLSSSLFDYAQLAWAQVDADRLRLKISFDSAPTDAVDVRVLLLGS